MKTSPDQEILRILARPGALPMTAAELVREPGLAGAGARCVTAALHRLARDGRLVCIKGDRYCLPREAGLVTGTAQFRQNGSALVIPEQGSAGAGDGAVRIAAEDTGVAMHGDRVVVRLDAPNRAARRGETAERSGRIIRVLERGRTTLTGALVRSRLFCFVEPDDPRFVRDICVPDPAKSTLQPRPAMGDKVVVRLHEWTQRHLNPEGEIIEVLGRDREPAAELAAIFHKFRLPKSFPPAVEAAAAALPDRVAPSDLRGREDLRPAFVFTIDPDDAKDFDDALSIEPLPRGGCRVGVHIADVSAYVRPGTALDREARERGNSTYLVGTVVPMLPFKLSNGLCSLVEGEDRLTKSVLLSYDRDGRLHSARFANTVIRSRKRLTYRQALALLREDDLRRIRALPLPAAHETGSTGSRLDRLPAQDLARLQEAVRGLWAVASRLRERRMAEGALDLDMPEVKIHVDEQGRAERLEKVEYDESHQLVEEFMLAANEAVAKATRQHALPSLYRVHDSPDPEKLAELRETMAASGIRCGDLSVRGELSRLLVKLKDHPQGHVLRTQVLRSLRKAVYRDRPDGHFGLNKRDYTHFTSPIRRYSDLVVHRVLAAMLVRHHGAPQIAGQPPQYKAAQAAALAGHLSLTEQNSTEAERDSVKVKLIEFFEREAARRKPVTYEAVITEVRPHGLFVELTGALAFGFVPASRMRDDFYVINAAGTALVGRRTKRQHVLGGRIPVVVDKVDRAKRQIDFRPA